MIDQTEGHEVPPTLTELHEKLRNQEAKLISLSSNTLTSVPVSANYVTNMYRGNNNNNTKQHSRPQQTYQQ